MNKKFVSGYFLDEHDLIEAIKKLKDKKANIKDVFTPFPIHGLDDLLGLKKSRIPTVGFIFGAIGAIGAFVFQAWIFTTSYPVDIGGKPKLSIPTFIPVIFETTVLFAAIAIVFAFLIRSKLGLGANNKIYNNKITDDHFVVLLESEDENGTSQLTEHLKLVGAEGITDEGTE